MLNNGPYMAVIMDLGLLFKILLGFRRFFVGKMGRYYIGVVKGPYSHISY